MRISPTKSVPSNLSFIEAEDRSVCDPTEMANTFNKHFTNIQQNADTPIPVVDTNKQNQRITDFVESGINNSTVFHIPPLRLKQVVEDLKNIPDNKATGLDGIGIKPFKKALNAVTPSLTHIYNTSIASGSFPDNLKRAKLTPVHKNNSIHNKNKYRPISILPVISKPLERHVARSYLDYLTSNTLLHSKQSAYRPYVVDPSLLLSKISMYYTDNTSLRWFESYLHDRTQRCCVNGSLSDALPIT